MGILTNLLTIDVGESWAERKPPTWSVGMDIGNNP